MRADDPDQRIRLAVIGAFSLIAFGGSFRGHDVFLVDTYGLLKYAAEKQEERGLEFVMVPLLGRYKSEDSECYHLTPLAIRTDSGLEIGRWVHRLADAKKMQKLSHGPEFSDAAGHFLESR